MVKALTLLRFALGGTFIVAGAFKLGDPLAFARAIDGYAFVPDRLVTFAAAVLPWLEIAAGGALVMGRWSLGGAMLAFILVVAFLGIAIAALARGLDPNCGCFGPAGGRVGAWLVAQDLLLAAAAGVLLWRRNVPAPDAPPSR